MKSWWLSCFVFFLSKLQCSSMLQHTTNILMKDSSVKLPWQTTSACFSDCCALTVSQRYRGWCITRRQHHHHHHHHRRSCLVIKGEEQQEHKTTSTWCGVKIHYPANCPFRSCVQVSQPTYPQVASPSSCSWCVEHPIKLPLCIDELHTTEQPSLNWRFFFSIQYSTDA
jgi:hypothetical protein